MRNRGPWGTLEASPWPEIRVGQTTVYTGRNESCEGPTLPDQLARFLPGTSFHVPEQVHGSEFQSVRTRFDACYPGNDGLVTDMPGPVLMVRVADCVPVVLYNRRSRRLALLHVGWRGLVKGLIPRTLEQFPDSVEVLLGAHIRGDRYEVGSEVIEGLESCLNLSPDELRELGILSDRNHLSLHRAIQRQLRDESALESFRGFPQGTGQSPVPLFSYRKNSTSERMLFWVLRRRR